MVTATGEDCAMTTREQVDGEVLARCVEAAGLAPSLHNSQPWRFRIAGGSVEVFADRRRRLDVLDPSGRELLVSVGAALFTLRLAMRRAGRIPDVALFPDPDDLDLVARVRPGRAAPPSPDALALADAIARRHTNRWPFTVSLVPADVIERLTDAAAHEGATLTIAGAVSRDAILGLGRAAERRLQAHGAYRAELGHWTRRNRRDGVPATAIGPWDALERLPMRDFGLLPPQPLSTERFEDHPTIGVLSTEGDDPVAWVRAGQALQRVLLVATRLRLATTPISQPVEIPAIRELLTDTRAGRWAQMIVRLGYGAPAVATPRRPLAEILEGPSG
jgi:nitroreductase